MDVAKLKEWVGRTNEGQDEITAYPVVALGATLDYEDAVPRRGDAIPPLWHWLYFLPTHRQSEVGADGHPSRGGFLPPVPLPRRMWAGSRLQFHAPLRVGELVSKVSTVLDVSAKTGRTGTLAFVKVEHKYHGPSGLAISEEQDIVYREAAGPGAPSPEPMPAPSDEEWVQEVVTDPVLLFRFSALTFNGHRIHFDKPYATAEEHYPNLVVHGPLQAMLLLELVRKHLPDATVRSFSFRGVRPTFTPQKIYVCGKRKPDGKAVDLWIRHEDGALAMSATAELN
ncbi:MULTISPECIES: MaoC family dehydratase N-terminal domain-containing protein [unclassified Cupriavidus]|uniref:FAS1-like dehydratase domain-containing protein n=1 Tax=unclassified Cupriavidus TaxID=2640874 RepID=UPI001C0031AD|nr:MULTISPECIES: MaoC family dehydratase N-terminal domain-containing protein [unclassified Cupriavidus]MCA3186233.1 MaoC family dehydratase N-terminal domain-containing protein [Cupriavidus sp.]MCA3189148.1 MaoC family dehydratase N-terminal domain-containing protein [Cupriavidus sp.]MCA3198868.1 MaoC family dehydratase N-terminal domain-containing protein [Cupriavidus sp.]MCA3201612.1 MaoC family dehydratase N-terminal domain-containing protein [Cupriavidus sp.]MCA3233124.1 MaoC family dehyd